MIEKITYLFVYRPTDNPTDPTDSRVKTQLLDYDARGNLTHIEREINNPDMPMDTSRESVQKLVWDEEDRLLGVDLRPESSRGQPHIAAYTYDAGGERGIRYVPRQQEGVSSGTTAGYAQDMDIMLYPNALITVRPQELPEDFDPMRMHPEHTFTTYTKHYYIGSERINSKLGTVNSLGLLCEEMGGYDLVRDMNTRTSNAGEQLDNLYNYLDKDLRIDSPYLYGETHRLVCGFKSHDPKMYDAYWYHPDHLGSSSYITNTSGEISQHMEYLPFGETLVEEHLNSHNSPFKFNGKEYDAETGNYYMSARYYSQKYNLMLSVDPASELYPGVSPYIFALQNPVRFIDPTGMVVEDGGQDPPSDDKKLFPNTAGVQVLKEVVIIGTARKRIDFSGGMPDHLKHGQPLTWDSPYSSGTLDQYNQDYNTDYTEGNQWNQWYYQNFYKREFDAMIADIHSATHKAAELFMYIMPTPLVGAELLTKAPTLYRSVMKSYRMSNAFRIVKPSALNRTLPGFTDKVSGTTLRQGRGPLLDYATRKPAMQPINNQHFNRVNRVTTGVGLTGLAYYYYYRKTIRK